MTLPVGLYARISDDQEGSGLGVGRQEQDCRTVASLRDWEVACYIDNSVSAFKRKVVRPRFEAMLADLAAGRLSGIVVYDLDRLARQNSDLERVIKIYEDVKGLCFATVAGDIDLSGDGVTMARVMVAFANKASKDAGRRIARKHLELAQAGIPVGGTRPFGYGRDKRTLNPAEAEVIREGVRAIAHGQSIASVVHMWNDAGLTTPRGGRWVSQTVKQVLRNPRIAGFRARKIATPGSGYVYEIVTGADGEEVEGQWTAVVPRDEWEAANARLDSNADRAPGMARKYLLSGICRCGRKDAQGKTCNAPMRALPAPRRVVTDEAGNTTKVRWGGEDNFYYQCPPKSQGGCGGVARSGPTVDALVCARVIARASAAAGSVEAVEEVWDEAEALEHVRSRIADAQEAYDKERISSSRFFSLLEKEEGKEKALLKRQRAFLARTAASRVTSADIESEWESATMDRKRALISQRLSAVIIYPVVPGPGSRTFDPSLVVPVWRD